MRPWADGRPCAGGGTGCQACLMRRNRHRLRRLDARVEVGRGWHCTSPCRVEIGSGRMLWGLHLEVHVCGTVRARGTLHDSCGPRRGRGEGINDDGCFGSELGGQIG